MLHRDLDLKTIYGSFKDYSTWLTSAGLATKHLCGWYATNSPGTKLPKDLFDSAIYGALKDSLKSYFAAKCAYCESSFDAVAWGDVEHYRPKRGVSGEDHRGYYWLAYNERNLLPSCQLCNQGKGKRNQFPIAGVRARQPETILI
jgi:hypothetical protein